MFAYTESLFSGVIPSGLCQRTKKTHTEMFTSTTVITSFSFFFLSFFLSIRSMLSCYYCMRSIHTFPPVSHAMHHWDLQSILTFYRRGERYNSFKSRLFSRKKAFTCSIAVCLWFASLIPIQMDDFPLVKNTGTIVKDFYPLLSCVFLRAVLKNAVISNRAVCKMSSTMLLIGSLYWLTFSVLFWLECSYWFIPHHCEACA